MTKRSWAGLLAASAALGFSMRPPNAHAKEQFPGEVARHLAAPQNPPCGLCHEWGKTGGSTLVTPFAWAMRARGLTGGSSLLTALDRVAADKVDSDGDGALDVDEIVGGADPNSVASTPTQPGSVEDPQLGCSLAGDGRPTWIASLSALTFLVFAIGVRRPTRRRPGPERRPRRSLSTGERSLPGHWDAEQDLRALLVRASRG